MLAENLKVLRKQKGFSQEELAVRVNVVRQTVSKWEKGLSVPDADALVKLAEVLGVSTSELLGEEVKNEGNSLEVAEQLSKIAALMAIQMQRKQQLIRIIVSIIGTVVLIMFIAAIYPKWTEIWHEFGQNLYHMLND
ncbi:MAG: helix-turn-helix domain-containing protein [Lachnospiraceae bacterium]|nr:helix-turn-helix domain-containing protein [Lachnospiraceae bacterium]